MKTCWTVMLLLSSSSSLFFLPSILLLLSSEFPEPVFMKECVFSSHSFLTYGIIGSSAFLKSIMERYSICLYSAREWQIRTSFQSHRAESQSWEETATEKPGKLLHIQLFRNWGCICMLDIVRWKWHFSLFLPSNNLESLFIHDWTSGKFYLRRIVQDSQDQGMLEQLR